MRRVLGSVGPYRTPQSRVSNARVHIKQDPKNVSVRVIVP